jgi:hypothetical protein
VADVLIRDLPDAIVAGLDEQARQAGLSRTEYLRRMLTREAGRGTAAVRVEDLARFAETFADLGDDTVMDDAWR